MLESGNKPDEARARLVAAGALALTAMIAFVLVMTTPRGEASQAAPERVWPTSLAQPNLRNFVANPNLCRQALIDSQIEIAAAPDVKEGGACGYERAVELTQSLHPYSQPVVTSCAEAAALVLWERDVVGPAARRHFGQDIARIEMAGPSYACRPIAGRADGRMSEHASANAMDIAGFTLADGQVVSVEKGWQGAPAEQAFLREVRDGGCGLFQVVLSPDYNRAHHDHLHLDMGRWTTCH